jgi:asparagine synthase (glutamine-hydrolysing)
VSFLCGAIARSESFDAEAAVGQMLGSAQPRGRATFASGDAAAAAGVLLQLPREREEDAFAFDGRRVMVCDARLDARFELAQALGEDAGCGDATLILLALARWGVSALDQLIGDFAFAVLDLREVQLLAARDRFGVRPFFYAETRDALLFASALAPLHAFTSGELDDDFVGDVLLFGTSLSATATLRRGVRRLAPAHRLRGNTAGVESSRYWEIPDGDAVDMTADAAMQSFNRLLARAVSDRMDGSRKVAVAMSGGLDSPYIAATAKHLLERSGEPFSIHAITFANGARDEELRYASIAANALGLTHEMIDTSQGEWYEAWEHEPYEAEPSNDPQRQLFIDLCRGAAARAPLMLTGFGGDALLATTAGHYADLLRRGRIDRFVIDTLESLWRDRRLPPYGLRHRVMRQLPWRSSALPPMPAWIAPDLARAESLRARWADEHAPYEPKGHPRRPEAADKLQRNGWALLFESFHPTRTGVALEVSHPFFDVRLIEAMLALPSVPLFNSKRLLRNAARGVLPDAVVDRPKATTPASAGFEALTGRPDHWLALVRSSPELKRWIDADALAVALQSFHSGESYRAAFAVSFAVWLIGSQRR